MCLKPWGRIYRLPQRSTAQGLHGVRTPVWRGTEMLLSPGDWGWVTPTATSCSGCPRPVDASEKQGPALGIQFLKLITDGKGAQEDVSAESLGTVDGLENMLLKWTLPKPGRRKRRGIGPHWWESHRKMPFPLGYLALILPINTAPGSWASLGSSYLYKL